MTADAQTDPQTAALTRLLGALTEEIMYGLAAAPGDPLDTITETIKRRKDAHGALLQGQPIARMTENFDAWFIEMARAMAPVHPPEWIPMSDVIREKVTLEVGARGLRSLFSSKPSDKDVARVKKMGTLAVRVLRAVFASDGPIDGEEARAISAIVSSLGLPDADAAPLYTEMPVAVEHLEVYGDIEPAIAKAIVRGAWLAAVWDALDPREETVIRNVAQKLAVQPTDVETMRNEAIARVESRRTSGLATVDAVRYVLADRVPGYGVALAAFAGHLTLPRRFREEALAQVGHGAPVALAQRYKGLTSDEKLQALAIAYAAALHDDPSVARQSLLRARLDRVAVDLGDDPSRARKVVDQVLAVSLAEVATTMR
jgi:tellurite resistance protein